MRTLLPRESQLVAVALLVGLILTGWQFVVFPIAEGFIQRARDRDDLIAEYERNDRILAGLPGWRLEAEEQARTAAAFAIAAPSEAIAVELISQRIARDAQAAGGVVQVTQPVTDKPAPGWVHVRSVMQLTIGQLYAVLMRIQSGEPYVMVGYLSVEARSNANPNEPQSLAVRIDIFAPFRASGAPPPPGTAARRI